jgi:hypothetical protein
MEATSQHDKNQLKANYFVNNLADAILLDQLDALALLVWPVQVKRTWARPDNRALKTGCKPVVM